MLVTQTSKVGARKAECVYQVCQRKNANILVQISHEETNEDSAMEAADHEESNGRKVGTHWYEIFRVPHSIVNVRNMS